MTNWRKTKYPHLFTVVAIFAITGLAASLELWMFGTVFSFFVGVFLFFLAHIYFGYRYRRDYFGRSRAGETDLTEGGNIFIKNASVIVFSIGYFIVFVCFNIGFSTLASILLVIIVPAHIYYLILKR